MDTGEALYNHLISDSGISSINVARTFPLQKETGLHLIEDTYIIYQMVSRTRPLSFSLERGVTDELWQIDVYAKDADKMYDLAKAVLDSLDAYQGGLPVGVSPAKEFDLIQLESESQTFGDENDLFRTTLTFRFYYGE